MNRTTREPDGDTFAATPGNVSALRLAHAGAIELGRDAFVVSLDGVPRKFDTRYAGYLLEYLETLIPNTNQPKGTS